MGYLYTLLSVLSGTAKGYCGKRTSEFVKNPVDGIFISLLRMILCTLAGGLLLLTESVSSFRLTLDIFLPSLLCAAATSCFVVSWLLCVKNGAYIVIDHTEALTAIDVNTGKFIGEDDLQETLFETNCEAAREIARQIRLRDISGIIIIDFIDMEVQENKDALIDLLRNCMKRDRTKSNVLGMTGLGLIEMTRKKLRNPLTATLQEPCPYCHGESRVLTAESVALRVRTRLLREMANTDLSNFLIEVSPAVAAFIEKKTAEGFSLLPKRQGKNFYVRSVPGQHVEHYEVRPIADKRALESSVRGSEIKCY